MWVRGLKFVTCIIYHVNPSVAPHVGAWIELLSLLSLVVYARVAPHVGAWIEIILAEWNKRVNTSRTPCGCVD